MDNFPMAPAQRAPELPKVHLELIASPAPDRIQQRVEMIDKPSPNLPGSHSFRRGRIGTDRFLDGWELWHQPNRA